MINMNLARVLADLCPVYRKAVITYFEDFHKAPDFLSKEKLFLDFTQKFTTIPQIWYHWISFYKWCFPDSGQKYLDFISLKALSHFFNSDILLEITDHPKYHFLKSVVWTKALQGKRPKFLWPKSIEEKEFLIKALQKKLLLPTRHFKLFYEFCDEYSGSSIPKEIIQEYENAEILGRKFCYFYSSKEKWLNLLKETNDDKFIIQNFELKIGTHQSDKNLWLLYLSFTDEKQLYIISLTTYSRYCRFFIDDKEMREKYYEEIERIKKMNIFDLTNFQMDLIQILHHFDSKESAIVLMKKYFEEMSDEMINQKLEDEKSFSLLNNTAEIMTFPDFAVDFTVFEKCRRKLQPIHLKLSFNQKINLPRNILYYLFKNANFQLLQKLYATSKQIYSNFKKPICHRLEICELNSTVSFQQCLYVSNKTVNFKTAKNLFLTNALEIYSSQPNSENILSKIIPNIYKCNIRYLTFNGQKISMNEFEFFASNLHSFKMSDSLIGDKEVVSIKDIIDKMPKIKKLHLSNTLNLFFLPPNEQLLNGPKSAIKRLQHENITEMIDPKLLLNFILENDNKYSQFIFSFDPKIEESYKDVLRNDIELPIRALHDILANFRIL